MQMTISLKQSEEALALRVLRKTLEYNGHKVALWICPDGSAHILPEYGVRRLILSPSCVPVGVYRAPCTMEAVLEDILWVVRSPSMRGT